MVKVCCATYVLPKFCHRHAAQKREQRWRREGERRTSPEMEEGRGKTERPRSGGEDAGRHRDKHNNQTNEITLVNINNTVNNTVNIIITMIIVIIIITTIYYYYYY